LSLVREELQDVKRMLSSGMNNGSNIVASSENDEALRDRILSLCNGVIKRDLQKSLRKDPILKLVSHAAHTPFLQLTDKHQEALQSFRTNVFRKRSKLGKEEKAVVKNTIRTNYLSSVRQLWQDYQLFDKNEPRVNLISTKLLTIERFTLVTETLAAAYCFYAYNNKEKLCQVQLPTQKGKCLNIT
jgi:hypothetical protein